MTDRRPHENRPLILLMTVSIGYVWHATLFDNGKIVKEKKGH